MGGSIARRDSREQRNRSLGLRVAKHLSEAAKLLPTIPDEQIVSVLGQGQIDALLKAILDPAKMKESRRIGDIFLENKRRLQLLAAIHRSITANYVARPVNTPGAFASPFHEQWVKDGVLFLEGRKPFSGTIVLYKNGQSYVGVVARDTREDEPLQLEKDLLFIPLEDFRAQRARVTPAQLEGPNRPDKRLRALLDSRNNDEGEYQSLFEGAPWSLGMQYELIQRHLALDNENVPDFTGVRSHDRFRDIIEVKPPFMPIVNADGETFSAPFNAALTQAERYLDFARRNRDYLYGKGLDFENPACILIAGFDLSRRDRDLLRVKERSTVIRILTYNDIAKLIDGTLTNIRNLQQAQREGQPAADTVPTAPASPENPPP